MLVTAYWNILSLAVCSVENSSAISVGQMKLLNTVGSRACQNKESKSTKVANKNSMSYDSIK
jgi:hypothetical protein